MCSKTANDTDSVTCDICRNLVHSTCAGLSRAEVDCLRSKRKKINFFCDNCDIISTINDLKKNILELKTEIEALKNSNRRDPDPEPGKKSSLSEDEIIAELESRQVRSNNLILYNLEESNKTSAEERKNDDLVRCKQIILANLDENKTANLVSCFRIGKFINEKNRLLKITFSNQQQAYEVLKSYRTTNRLYLNKDLTAYQRSTSYNIRREFRERKNNGEDVILKYRNGMPQIIVKKNV